MRKKWSLVAVVIVLVLVLPMLFGCGRDGTTPKPPDDEEKYIVWLSLSDYTGPAAGMNIAGDLGTTLYFDYFNDSGGADGVKVKFIGVDTRYEVARAISAYHMYRNETHPMIVFASKTGAAMALEPLMEEDDRVSIASAAGYFQQHPGRVLLLGSLYQDTFGSTIDFILDDWQKKGKTGKPKLGYIHFDNPYGREALNGGAEYAELKGVDLLQPQFFPMGTLKHDIYLEKLKDADYIFNGSPDPTIGNLLRDAHAMGLTEKIQFISGNWGLDETVGLAEFPEACEGAWRVEGGLIGNEARENAMVETIWNEYRDEPISEMPAISAYAMTYGMAATAALEEALKEVSYEELTGSDLYAAYQRLTGKDVFYGIAGLCAYSPTSRRGADTVRFYEVRDSQFVPLTGWWPIPMDPNPLELAK